MDLNLKTLNEQQQEAVTHTVGPLLIVAGAGTGKTTVITQRIGYLIEQGKVKTDEILALTFTDKAAGEMEERVDKLLPYGFVDLWIMTFHSFAERILQRHGLEIGIPNDFKLLNQTEQWMLVRQNLEAFGLDYYRPLGNPAKFIHALVKLFSRAKDDNITPQNYLAYAQELKLNADAADFITTLGDTETAKKLSKKERTELIAQEIAKHQEVANAYHVYQQLLLDHNALDFGDLINYCLQLFVKRPLILNQYRNKFKYILVDEFQDTNHAQFELVKLLAAPHNNITVVGDDDQSIYKFRGASVSNILEFKRDYPKAKEVFLTKNYRSTQDILDLSYKFIVQNNPDRLEVKLSKKGKQLSKKLESQGNKTGTIKHLHFTTADDEVRGILQKIAELKNSDAKLSWGDFAILSRTNDAANLFAHGLSQTNIPYRFLASRGLYGKPVILDIISYLRLLDDYHENSAVYQVLNSPMVGLSHRDLVKLNYWAKRKGYSLFATIQQSEVHTQASSEVREKIRLLLDMVAKHTKLAKEKSVSEVVVTVLEDTGYAETIADPENIEALQNASYLNQFYKKITEFERSSENRGVKAFIELINLELEAGEMGSLSQDFDESPDAVKVMTVHAAKGLEFEHVFVVNLVDRRFPTDNRPDPILLPDALIKEILPEGDAHLQEERRLFYVAMTRAGRGLYFSSANDYGGSRKKKISRFLSELEALGFPLDGTTTVAGKHRDVAALGMPKEKITREDVSPLIPKRFSYSQLKTFQHSPYQYWVEYILKIPQPGKSFFSFGSSIHNTLQRFFMLVQQRADAGQQDLFSAKKISKEKKPLVSFEELFEIYQKGWIDDWYPSRAAHDEYFKKGKAALKDFYTTYAEELPVPQLLETPITAHVTDQESGETYAVAGKIDRVDPVTGGLEIIDYKTGSGKTEQSLTTDDKDQLLIYQLAATQQLTEPIKKLTYYYLESGTRLSFVGSEKDLARLEKKVVKIIQEIKNFDWPPQPTESDLRDRV